MRAPPVTSECWGSLPQAAVPTSPDPDERRPTLPPQRPQCRQGRSIWVMQLARWPSSRVRTSVLTPSHVDRKRVTSFMHSLKPARYFPSTLGSVLSAAAGQEETDGSPNGPGP